MNKIDLFQNNRVWDEIKGQVWTLVDTAHQQGRAQNSFLVQQLEQRLAQQLDVNYCVTTASGTDALVIALKCLDLPPGSRVAVSTYTFIASAHAIARAGHIPVPIDIDKTYCIDVSQIKDCVAVIAVDIFGNMSNWSALNQLGIPVICDAAQSLESQNQSRWSVSHGTISCTSFAPSKPISSWGSGGAVFTNSVGTFERAQLIRLHGKSKNNIPSVDPGLNSMISSFEAACILIGLDLQPVWHKRRTQISEYLLDSSNYTSPMDRSIDSHSYSKLVFQSSDRNETLEKFHKVGIATAIHYPMLVHQETLYKAHCPVADQASQVSFTVPNQHTLTDSEVERIAEALK